MPTQSFTYPGVYVVEVPSGNHTIPGVSTSITAFVGRTPRGPVNEPTTIFSFADFERLFGGIAYDYPVSYAVQDFFVTGGSQALIVRLYHQPTASAPTKPTKKPAPPPKPPSGTAQIPLGSKGGVTLEAANPGDWGNYLTVSVNYNNITQQTADHYSQRYGLAKGTFKDTDLFNLTVQLAMPNAAPITESFSGVTLKNTPPRLSNRLDLVLAQQSQLLRVETDVTTGTFTRPQATSTATPLPKGAHQGPYTATGGKASDPLDLTDYVPTATPHAGIYALDKASAFNILSIPPDTRAGYSIADPFLTVYQDATAYCSQHRAVLIVDSPNDWQNHFQQGTIDQIQVGDLGINGEEAGAAAVYFPRVYKDDPAQNGAKADFAASGLIAGIYAATDAARGVWKAPAGQSAGLLGVAGLTAKLTDQQNGLLNVQGINCLRDFPILGNVVWGARTLLGADVLESDYKYISVRRLTDFIEQSLIEGTKWAVFEPNNEALWSSLRLSVGTFLANLARQGAVYNYNVICDATNNTPADIALGIVNITVQFAPVEPAEFVVITIQQIAPQFAN